MYKQQYLEIIKKRLEQFYNIKENYCVYNKEFDLFAEFFVRNERYIFSKKVATLYSLENREYCFIKVVDKNDTLKYFSQIIDTFVSNIKNIINIHDEHMSSTVNIVFVSEEGFEEDTIKNLQKFKFYKSFAFGFKGWCHIGVILVDLKSNRLFYNKIGKEASKAYMPVAY